MQRILLWINNNKVFSAVILLNIIQYYCRLSGGSFSPDEIWHPQIMQYGKSLVSPDSFAVDGLFINSQGFGAAYWYIGHLIFLLSPFNFLMTLKCLAYLSMLSSLVWLYLLLDKLNTLHKTLIFIFISTLPALVLGIVFFKVITPENFAFNLSLLSLVISKNRHKQDYYYLAFVLLGFVAGLKINFAFSSVFIALLLLHEMRQQFTLTLSQLASTALYGLSSGIIGFLICNPLFLYDPRLFFHNLPIGYHSSLAAILNNRFEFFLITLINVYNILWYIASKNLKLALLTSTFVALGIVMAAQTYTYYWHLVPILLILLTGLLNQRVTNNGTRVHIILLLIMILYNIAMVFPVAQAAINAHLKLQKQAEALQEYIHLTDYRYDYVIHIAGDFNNNSNNILSAGANYRLNNKAYDIRCLIYPLRKAQHIFWRNLEMKYHLLHDVQEQKKINILYILYPNSTPEFREDPQYLDNLLSYCKLAKKTIRHADATVISYHCT